MRNLDTLYTPVINEVLHFVFNIAFMNKTLIFIPLRSVTVSGSSYEHNVGHFSFSEVYLIYTALDVQIN